MELEAIKQRLSIKEVLGHYGLYADKQSRLQCPFHDDSTPSLQVYYKTQTAYCFSSNCTTHGKSMDVVDFIMYMDKTSKHEAIQKAKTLINGNGTVVQQLTRQAVLTKVFNYFKNGVHTSQPAQDYVSQRGLDFRQIEVGYNGGQFHHGSRKEEALIKSCVEVGLLIDKNLTSRTGEKAYHVFGKWCIVFALRDKQQHVSGLYFRSTLNDTDQRHFYLKDRQGLYPRYPAVTTEQLILTESIIDAATLLQIPAITAKYRVLALYGTNGLTQEHLSAIKNLPQLQEIIFWLNADQPGQEATNQHGAALGALYPDVRISCVQMPQGEDINSLSQGHTDTNLFTDLLSNRKVFSFSTEKKQVTQLPMSAGAPSSIGVLSSVNAYKLRYNGAGAIYDVQGGLPKGTDNLKIMLVIQDKATGQKARNRIDLYEDKQVEKLSKEVGEKLGIAREVLGADLYRLTELLEQAVDEALQGPEVVAPKEVVLTPQERAAIADFARRPQLIKRLNELLGKTGIVGEYRNRIFLLIIAISHKMPEPLHALIQGSSGSGKTRLLKQISDCIAPDRVTKLTRLSDKVLYNFPEHYFVNRLLCLEDMDGLSEEAEFALRELQSNGELNSATSIKLDNGAITSGQRTVRGPVASLSCTTHGELYEDNMGRLFLIAVDESQEQTERIIGYQNGVAAGEILREEEDKAKGMIRDFIGYLQPCKVVNPYASKIQLPPQAHKIRRLNDLFQGFVKMVTIVNQYQRKVDGKGRLVTQLEDIETAIGVMFESIVLKVDELDGSLRQFFEGLKRYVQEQHGGEQYQDATFCLRELRQSMKVSKTQVFRYMSELIRLEYVQQYGGYGNKGYSYRISYWDHYEKMRQKIKISLEEQVKALQEIPINHQVEH